MTRLKGAPIKVVLEAIERAVAPRDRWILDVIADQVEEYGESHPDDEHGFCEWILLIEDGAASLPDKIPFTVLTAWRDAYDTDFHGTGKPWAPKPFWRCEDCRMVLPHCPGWSGPCPVCQGSRIWFADLSKSFGQAWVDPHPSGRPSS